MTSLASRFREPFSGLSHLVGAVLALFALAYMLISAPDETSNAYLIGFTIFGLSMAFMFGSSAVYHLAMVSGNTLTRLKRIDHCAIYVMIAGTYTPYCLVGLDQNSSIWMLAVIWLLALLGILKKIFWIHAPRWLSTMLYLGMGWLSLIIYPELQKNVAEEVLTWLLAGGVTYSIGAIIYGLKWPNPSTKFGFHELWHLFVLGGAACHFVSIAVYL